MMGIDTIIGLASLAIAVPGLVQTFIHAGRWLSEKLRTTPGSSEIAKMQDFILFLDRGTMRTTLETVEDLYTDTSDTSLKSSLEASTEKLWAYMVELDKQIRKLKSSGNSEKQMKKATEAALAAIKDMYDLESRLRAYVQAQIASKTLRSRFELRATQFCLIGSPTKVVHSTSSVAVGDFSLHDRRGYESCVIEERVFPGLPSSDAYEKAVDLARTFQSFDASSGLLELAGFQVLTSNPWANDRFRYIFSFPKDRMNPRSLRDIFLDPINKPTPPIPRNYRFILPRKLAEAVYHVHQQNLVHKCIRPECILVFEPAPGDSPKVKYPKIIGTPFLVDWEHVRRTVEVTQLRVYDDWTMALYQHPERQASPSTVGMAEFRYNIGHDIYSLGVCLLEIGLWDSFVMSCEGIPKLSPVLTAAKAKWKRENDVACQSMTDSQIEQKVFIMLAADRLAYEMGEVYSRLVIKCLTCLEKGFGNVLKFVDSASRDWDEQGVLFIQEIRRELKEASIMGS
ncbi:uncharacterized protein FTOL_08657 [Fusarium torulosum]|uniref:Protein kinase domain-containing protein n=1 Tax=Fusarium torulosum TaxID=33205 RepID=A0AAE8MD60_9HYPO|nr:uncharacterized protein FTOL_08657 [Fusarium torulosum]